MDELMTQEELCKWLKISPMTAYRWRKKGMPYIGKGKSIRYEKKAVLKWLKENSKLTK
ncbi:MAG: helix-turn-helix domain-containing protein [Thermoanaerobacter sp.]|nr:helix-turn-helix domain-containing protein [Thermoanaerobacter sp.]